ncbi:MAG: hypothetical protein RIT45_1336 [Pseudomonadota bacterium]|jgi:hypothetical protein
MSRVISHRALALLLATSAALALPLTGCGPKKKQKEVRAEKGDARLAELMTERRKTLIEKMPTSDEPDGSTHPWLQWVGQVAGTVSRAELKKVGVIARGTKVAGIAETLATWFEAQKKFYYDEKMDRKEFYRDLSVAAKDSEGRPWEMDVEFDRIFFHAAEAARTPHLFKATPTDDQVTRFFTYWTFVWDFKPKTGILEDEVNALCKEKLEGYCDKIPMELRPFQLMRPYYEKVQGMIAAFRTKYPSSPYEPFLTRLDAFYKARIAAVPEWKEEPRLVPMRSTKPAPVSNNAVLFVTEQGIALMDNLLRKPDDPEKPWKADWKTDSELPGQISLLVEDVRSSTVSNFNQSRIFVVPQEDVPVRFLEPLMRATIVGEHAKEWPTMILVGRRREDGSNRRVGYDATILAADKVVPFKLAIAEAKVRKNCTAWAVAGAQALGAKGFGPAIYHDGEKVWTGKLATDGTLRDAQGAAGHGEGDRLVAWADAQTQSIVVAVDENASYADWIEAMNGVVLRCEGEECKTPRNQPVFFATCQ